MLVHVSALNRADSRQMTGQKAGVKNEASCVGSPAEPCMQSVRLDLRRVTIPRHTGEKVNFRTFG